MLFIGIFKPLADYKQAIKELIFAQQDLMKLIQYPNLNPLEQPDIDNPYLLLNSKVFFSPRSFDTIENAQSIILVNFDAYGSNRDNIYFNININFDIIIHNSIIALSNDTDRMDLILDCVDSWLNALAIPNCGIGRTKFEKLIPMNINKDYIAYRLVYSTNNFNQNYNRQV